jgi:hypothetical protein
MRALGVRHLSAHLPVLTAEALQFLQPSAAPSIAWWIPDTQRAPAAGATRLIFRSRWRRPGVRAARWLTLAWH